MLKVVGVFLILASLVLLGVSIMGPLAFSFLEFSATDTPPRPAMLGRSISLTFIFLSLSVATGTTGLILLVVAFLKK